MTAISATGWIHISADKDAEVKDIRLVTGYTPAVSTCFTGVGYRGGLRLDSYSWDWKGPWDSYWISDYRAGLHVEFRGGAYHGPFLNDYKPAPPESWANDGQGRVSVSGTPD
jgi:hypothetical protein